MNDFLHLIWFVPAMFMISILPGLCTMTALSLGMSVGFRRSLWMIFGELIGAAQLGLLVGFGLAAIILKVPQIFFWIQLCGGLFLIWVAWGMWREADKALKTTAEELTIVTRRQLILQGYLTACSNPKGWVFMGSLIPPFINHDVALVPQVWIIVAIMVFAEAICMMIYAAGGHVAAQILSQPKALRWVRRIAALLILGLAVKMLLSVFG